MAGQDDQGAEPGGQLRKLLLDAGVGTKPLTLRELGKRSGLPLRTWQRLIQPVPEGKRGQVFEQRVLQTAVETLRHAGVDITLSQAEYAAWLDLATFGSGSAAASDVHAEMAMIHLQHLSPAQRLRFHLDQAQLAADEAARNAEPEGSSNDRQDPHLRP